MNDYGINRLLEELEQKKIEAKKQFEEYEDEVAYGRYQAFQESQDIINKHNLKRKNNYF